MKNLIIPMVGKSSRFPNMRPKWMLTHPKSNNLMCIESIKGINLDFFDKIYFVFTEKHELEYKISYGLQKCIDDNKLKYNIEFLILKKETKSQSETIYNTIKQKNISGFIFVKDSDGYFELNLKTEENQISYMSLNNVEDINAKSKSYLTFDINGLVSNIVEKKVISPYFSVGGYGFNCAEFFCETFEKLNFFEEECYISNVIYEMLLDNIPFKGVEVSNFLDWGTLDSWKKYCNEFSTIFIDIDGTLISNSSKYIPPFYGEGTSLTNNIVFLNQLYDNKKVTIILTTSRPQENEKETILELKKNNIKYDKLIMGLPHTKRILINDFSSTNSFPTAISVNLPRNSDNLKNYL